MRITVRKIRPEDPGFDQIEARIWPWLVFGRSRSRDRAQAFATHRQALHYAVTGNRLRLSPEDLRLLRERPLYQKWQRQVVEERRRARSSA